MLVAAMHTSFSFPSEEETCPRYAMGEERRNIRISPKCSQKKAAQRKTGNWELGRKIFVLPLSPISGKRFADFSQDWPVKGRGTGEDGLLIPSSSIPLCGCSSRNDRHQTEERRGLFFPSRDRGLDWAGDVEPWFNYPDISTVVLSILELPFFRRNRKLSI